MKRDPVITAAINDLKEYKRAKVEILNYREQLYVETLKLTTPRGASLSAVPTHGGGNAYTDALSCGVDKKDELKAKIDDRIHCVAIMERSLRQLTPDEREVIRLMYIDENVNAYGAGLLIHRCKTRVYEIRNSALLKLYGYIHGIKKSGKKTEFI